MRRTAPIALALLAACAESPLPWTADDAGAAPPDLVAAGPDARPPDAATGSPAYVARGCAPNDGPAVTLLLYGRPAPECGADPNARSLEFVIYGGSDRVLPISAPATVTSTPARPNGVATECLGGKAPCRITSDFTLVFDAFALGGPASGRYAARFDGAVVTGTFQATWCEPAPPRCG